MQTGMSFAARVLDWLVAPVLFLWFVGIAATLFIAIDTINAPFDKRLSDLSQTLGLYLRYDSTGSAGFDMPPGFAASLLADSQDDLHYVIRDSSGRIIAGDDKIPPPKSLPKPGTVAFASDTREGDDVRIATLALAPHGPAASSLIVQVAETLSKRHALASEVYAHVVLPQVFVLVGALFLVWYGLTYVMSPLQRLKQAIDARDSRDFTPFDPSETPPEIRPLISSLNDLMKRLAFSQNAHQRFIADAAHQLRTPLAGLKSQTELALRDSDPEAVRHALKQLALSSQRLIRVANQLLSLVRVETIGIAGRSHVLSLNDLARTATELWVATAVERKIDLGFEAAPEAPKVRGDSVLLGELLNNVIDNALHYTPAGGQVNVRVLAGEHPAIRVEDTGVGVPESERELVFQPFYRVNDHRPHLDLPGSGLGLAIVREIAVRHGATVNLGPPEAGCGTVVQVQFAAAA